MSDQLTLGLILVFFQNWLKASPWMPWLNYERSRANHLFAVLASGAATLGISVVHTGSFHAGGTILITVPAGSVLAAGVWHWLTQYAISKGLYKALEPRLTPSTTQAGAAAVSAPATKA